MKQSGCDPFCFRVPCYNTGIPNLKVSMLYPQSNLYRQVIELSGFWELLFDPQD